MSNSNCQFQTLKSTTSTIMFNNFKKCKSQDILGKSASDLSVFKVQILPKNGKNTMINRRLANSLTNQLQSEGVNAYTSNNNNIRDIDLRLDINISNNRLGYHSFRFSYASDMSYRIAQQMAKYLWFYHYTDSHIGLNARVEHYNLLRDGIVPLMILFPSANDEILVNAETLYTPTIAHALANFLVGLSDPPDAA